MLGAHAAGMVVAAETVVVTVIVWVTAGAVVVLVISKVFGCSVRSSVGKGDGILSIS
jgi:hypothetical protein